MSDIRWRLPLPGELPEVRLGDGLNPADVGEVLDQPPAMRLREIRDLQMVIIAPTAKQRLVAVLLIRNEDSFEWRVWLARTATDEQTNDWFERGA